MAPKLKSCKCQRVDILCNWSSNNGERVEEDNSVHIMTRDKNRNIVEHYDTKVRRKAGDTKCAPAMEEQQKPCKSEKVNNTTVRMFLYIQCNFKSILFSPQALQ